MIPPVLLLLLHLFALVSADSPPRTWEKVLLTEAAEMTGAVCLDGSPGGYFLSKRDPSKWVVFMEGGGWCGSDANCLSRASTDLGSSKHWKSTYTDTYEGSAMFASPPFDNYTVVFVKYCDGSSFTGNVAEPIIVGGGSTNSSSVIYYRGRRLLDAILDDLLAAKGLSGASSLLFSGCSAGGLTTYLHADYVRGRVPRTCRTLALADAMYSVDSDHWDGTESNMVSVAKWGYQAWNASSSVNEECVQRKTVENEEWRCMFGSVVAPFVKTPLFVLNSKYDTWQEKAIIGANCSIAQCPHGGAMQKFWVNYGQEMVRRLSSLPPRHGAFVGNCPAHCQTGSGYLTRTVNGTLMRDAFVEWYQDRMNGGMKMLRWVDECDVMPCGDDKC